MKEKSYVEDIDRSVYDFKDDEKDVDAELPFTGITDLQ